MIAVEIVYTWNHSSSYNLPLVWMSIRKSVFWRSDSHYHQTLL